LGRNYYFPHFTEEANKVQRKIPKDPTDLTFDTNCQSWKFLIQSSPVDGEFDAEFTGIDFCPVPPLFCINVDLLAADQSFGAQFGFGADRFDEFLSQQADGKFDKKDEVTKLLIQAFARGINLK